MIRDWLVLFVLFYYGFYLVVYRRMIDFLGVKTLLDAVDFDNAEMLNCCYWK